MSLIDHRKVYSQLLLDDACQIRLTTTRSIIMFEPDTVLEILRFLVQVQDSATLDAAERVDLGLPT